MKDAINISYIGGFMKVKLLCGLVALSLINNVEASVVIVDEDFDGVTLQGQVDESNGNNTSDFTHTMPAGWSMVRNRTDGVEEWAGWSVARFNFWRNVDTSNSTYNDVSGSGLPLTASNQTRPLAHNASGNVLVADADEWCDGNGSPSVNCPGGARLDTQVRTASYPVSSGRRVQFSFDHSYYHEVPQTAALNVIHSTGTTLISQFDSGLSDNDLIRESYSTIVTNPLASTSVQFEWDYFGDNDWYWVLDNVLMVCLPATNIDLTQSNLTVDDNDQLATGAPADTSTVSFQLRDNAGNPITEANVLVSFQATLGTLTNGGSSGTTVTALTDASGLATVTLNSSNTGTSTVTANVDLDCVGNTAEATITTDTQVEFTPAADISVTKSDSNASYTPGQSTTYSITISNVGPQAANNVSLSDTLPAGSQLTSAWTCPAVSTTGGATCPASGGSSGDTSVSTNGINLPANSSVTFNIPIIYSADPSQY